MRVLHTFKQGSPEWHAHRAKAYNASEAAAMMGASRFMKRSELLRMKATGVGSEISSDTQRLFDRGHAAEAAARPIVCNLIGKDLYPVTASVEIDGLLVSASYDGLDMGEEDCWENKLINPRLVEMIQAGELNDPHYYWQCEQQLLVVGAQRVHFTCSSEDGSTIHRCVYEAVPGRREALIAGWKQFAEDVKNYSPAAAASEVKAAPVESLPAVLVEMKGELAVKTNLDVFGTALKAFVAKIPAKPSTDQEFADAEAACKSLKKAEDALQAESERALAGLTSVNEVRTLIAGLHKIARDARLSTDKLVDARKRVIKEEEVNRGRQALAEFVRVQNESLGGEFIQGVAHDFPGCISGLKKFDSLRNAIDTHLAERKIEVSNLCAAIGTNVRWLRENASEFKFLFADTKSLVLKPHADFTELCQARIDNHKADVARKEAADRERQKMLDEDAAVMRQQEQARAAAAPTTPTPSTVVQATFAAPLQPEKPALQLVPAGPPTLNLGAINNRIAPLGITVSGLEKLGFPVAGKQGAASLYHESSFPAMVKAMADHLVLALSRKDAA